MVAVSRNIRFGLHIVVKRGVCYDNVAPPVCHTRESRIHRSRHRNNALQHTKRCHYFLEATFRNPGFRGSSQASALKRGTPFGQQKFDKYFAISCNGARQDVSCNYSFTNTKSNTGFRLVPKVVALNDPEPLNGRYFASFHPKQYVALRANYVKLIEARTMSATEM